MKALVVLIGLAIAWFGHGGASDLLFWVGLGVMGLGVALAVNWANAPYWFTDFFGSDSGDGGGGDGGGD